jgi:carbon-monoxide dehydrogenase medium subunit
VRAAEAALVGQGAVEEAVRAAAEEARQNVQPEGDVHASAEFRRHLAGVLTARALRTAWSRASGQTGGPHA